MRGREFALCPRKKKEKSAPTGQAGFVDGLTSPVTCVVGSRTVGVHKKMECVRRMRRWANERAAACGVLLPAA